MDRYLVEFRRPAEGWGDVRAAADGARRISAEMRAMGVPVRFLRSVYVPEDDSCFFLFEGPSAADVARAAEASRTTVTSVEQVLRLDVELATSRTSEPVRHCTATEGKSV